MAIADTLSNTEHGIEIDSLLVYTMGIFCETKSYPAEIN
jgi:hypothetical protein